MQRSPNLKATGTALLRQTQAAAQILVTWTVMEKMSLARHIPAPLSVPAAPAWSDPTTAAATATTKLLQNSVFAMQLLAPAWTVCTVLHLCFICLFIHRLPHNLFNSFLLDIMNTPDSMQGVSGNEFLKDGCYSINVIQSLLKTNDFSFIFLIYLFFILLLYTFFWSCRKL